MEFNIYTAFIYFVALVDEGVSTDPRFTLAGNEVELFAGDSSVPAVLDDIERSVYTDQQKGTSVETIRFGSPVKLITPHLRTAQKE